MKVFSLFRNSLPLLLAILCLSTVYAQTPAACDSVGPLRRQFQIEMPKGGVSGIFISRDSGNEIRGGMINEFGISVLGFSYSKRNGKVKLTDVASFLDKWYIRRVL